MKPIVLDPHFTPSWYAELWGVSADTVVRWFQVRWFQDREGVLKLQPTTVRGRRRRVELRIPYSLAMAVYSEKAR